MESSVFSPVAPVRPVAPYIGGKRNLAGRLVRLIEEVPHRTYVEVFMGMGGVFLRRRSRPPSEVVNDLSRDVHTLYLVLREHPAAFMDLLKWQVASRAEFERLMSMNPDAMTDLQRAARFLYLQRLAFGGKVTGRNFGVSVGRPSRFDIGRLAAELEELHDRLSGVVLERLPWADAVARYDRPETLMYLDPPYYGSEDDYGRELFGRDEFERMVEVLSRVRGRFLLSINDHPETRRLFGRFDMVEVETAYGLQGHGSKPARELIVRGR